MLFPNLGLTDFENLIQSMIQLDAPHMFPRDNYVPYILEDLARRMLSLIQKMCGEEFMVQEATRSFGFG
jgi:hypothetical protein